VRLSWLENAYSCYFTRKVGQTDLVLVRYEGLLVGVYKQDYKFLCIVVTTGATVVDQKLIFYILTPVTSKLDKTYSVNQVIDHRSIICTDNAQAFL